MDMGRKLFIFLLLRKVTDFSLICWIYYYFSTGSDYYYRVWAQSHSCTRCHPGYRGWAWRNDLRGHQPGQQGSCPHYWSPWQGNPQDHGWVQGEATEDSSVLGLWLLMLDYKICALIAGRTRISYFGTIPQPHWFATHQKNDFNFFFFFKGEILNVYILLLHFILICWLYP